MTYLLSESPDREEVWKYFYRVVKIMDKSALISNVTVPFLMAVCTDFTRLLFDHLKTHRDIY